MRRCGPVLVTGPKQQGQTHLALWRFLSDNPYNNKIHQTSYNPVTFAELNHFLLLPLFLSVSLSLFLSLSLPLCLSLSFEQWDLNNSGCHGFVQVIIPMCTALAGLGKVLLILSQQNHHCNTTTHTVYSTIVLSLLYWISVVSNDLDHF